MLLLLMNPLPLLDFTTDPSLIHALRVVQEGGYAAAHPDLTPEEKAIIYYYTLSHDCANAIKGPIAKAGGNIAEPAGLWLQAALTRLPAHVGPVYSAEQWPAEVLQELHQREAQGEPFGTLANQHWPNFMSSSTSQRIARKILFDNLHRKNCLLTILSRTGRYIEGLSHYGSNGRYGIENEQEVLFLPHTSFRVVGLRKQTSFTEIQLVES
ncbi:ADP-ribosyltransferase domain-containing protein [Hymenobacter sp. DH14]|uniref:ADP-ribosyltransferase domain-containing protein n=1 Tax=Hymenobacter cyanobacteriorum TaxID=2926463 RepID=A0A9X1VI18_9BACT|nr:ADP-ribosyltransferase domain-containing protein [Hymenobacter cyanobacteriorum]MCI1189226.1 ADP-ribosyltransferase domain-containing protein [Hymenobacter cyanobacteriorum]